MHWAFEQSPDCIKIMGCAGELQAMNVNGHGSANDGAESADAGFHHHLTKPVDANELSALLASVAG